MSLSGTDTTATLLEWILLYLATYPEVQRKAFKEIEEQIGTERPPNLHDRSNTPYTLAIMEEVMRHCPMAFLNLPHMSLEDVTLNGHFIPKGTQVFTYHLTIHRDEKVKY